MKYLFLFLTFISFSFSQTPITDGLIYSKENFTATRLNTSLDFTEMKSFSFTYQRDSSPYDMVFYSTTNYLKISTSTNIITYYNGSDTQTFTLSDNFIVFVGIIENDIINIYANGNLIISTFYNSTINPIYINYYRSSIIINDFSIYDFTLTASMLNQITNHYFENKLCSDSAPYFYDSSLGFTCDRTCEDVSYITNPNNNMCEPQPTVTCDDVLVECEALCPNGIFNFESSQSNEWTNCIMVDCTCNSSPPEPTDPNPSDPTDPTDPNEDDGINSAHDIQQTEQHLTTSDGDVYNTYTYTETSTSTVDLSELVNLNNKLDTYSTDIKGYIDAVQDTTTEPTPNIDLTETNEKLASIDTNINNIVSAPTTDTNISIDITSNDDLISSFSTTINNLKNDMEASKNGIVALQNLISTDKNNFSFTMDDGVITTCPYVKEFNITSQFSKNIEIDICSLTHEYRNIFYLLTYLYLLVMAFRIGISFLRGLI